MDDKDLFPDMSNVPMPGSNFDIGPSGSTTYKTAGMIPPPPAMVPVTSSMPPAPPVVPRGTMPAPGGAPGGAPPPPMPGMGQILGQAQAAGNQLYGPYTPALRNQLYAAMLQRQNSMPNAIGSSLASVGDAIAHGYGHDQTNFLDKTAQANKDNVQSGLGAFDTAQKQTLEATSAGMELQKMDPNSAISQVSRAAYGPLLAKLGYSPQALSRMSGANVESVAKVAADYGGKEMENLFHQAQLIVEGQFHQQELGEKSKERQMDAIKVKAEHPFATALPTAANKALDAQANEGMQGGGGSAPMFAKNPQTGHRIMSIDGGKNWVDAK